MDMHLLGRSDLRVSRLCLGTMTFGEQNSEAEAHAQLDRALAAGINFIDTAEMYPVPPQAETQGRTEACIGSWLARHGGRERLVIASKVAGRADWLPWLRGGPRLARQQITEALEQSLRRLQTDYVDLYQLHWPERATNFFGRLGYEVATTPDDAIPLAETLAVLADMIEAGKIRHIGLSNETPWGVMHALALSERLGLPRVVSVQNPYNLLNRSFEVGLAEIAHREAVPLLAYSPLAFGVLSGKYADGARPAGARLTRWDRFSRYDNPQAQSATAAYVALAREHGLDPAQMALAYVNSRPFLGANIIGATTLAQLDDNLASAALELPDPVLAGIEAIHQRQPNPAP